VSSVGHVEEKKTNKKKKKQEKHSRKFFSCGLGLKIL
jgi:hypothetical protein